MGLIKVREPFFHAIFIYAFLKVIKNLFQNVAYSFIIRFVDVETMSIID